MSADEYTPTEKQALGWVAEGVLMVGNPGCDGAEAWASARRWLDTTIAAAEARGEARGLEQGWDACIGEAFTALLTGKSELPLNPYRSAPELPDSDNEGGQ